jgi:mannosyltransferase OCH1-like enzyme
MVRSFDDLDKYILSNTKIIHQIWFDLSKNSKKIFANLQKYTNTWIDMGYTIHTWNESECTLLVKKKFKWFWETYKSFPYDIQRIDVIRYLIMYRYGGLYVDTDLACYKDIFQYINPSKIYIVESSIPIRTVSNLLMYSPSKHPFWMKVISELPRVRNILYLSRHFEIMNATGPGLLDTVYHKYRLLYGIHLFPSELFNPIGITNSCDLNYIDTHDIYTIHYGTGLWENMDSKLIVFLCRNYILISTLTIIIILAGSRYLYRNFKERRKIRNGSENLGTQNL